MNALDLARRLLKASRMLLAEEFTADQLAALSVMNMLKPVARAREFEELGLGPYTKDAPLIQALVEKGLVKIQGNGAIAPDKEKIKTTLKSHDVPPEYKMKLQNWNMQFKRPVYEE
jgi:hypothetical protein